MIERKPIVFRALKDSAKGRRAMKISALRPLAFCAVREHLIAVRYIVSPMPSLGVSSLDLAACGDAGGLFRCTG
ncbi:MAG: hypothetical protein JNK46_09875 [Methylobacteriaceae bacterium]|nr:hypothetical protein [Methylobacteriaceae bacterium]